jgi:hypothetical protein
MPKTAKPKRTAYIDESGDMGRDVAGGSSETITMSATVLDRHKEFEDIRGRYAPNTKRGKPGDKDYGELKFKSSVDDVKLRVLSDINELDPQIYSVVLYKEDIPAGTSDHKIYTEVAKRVVKDMAVEDLDYEVFFDEHDQLRNGAEETIFADVKNETERDIKINPPVKSKDSAGMQVNDFVAGSIGHKFNADPPKDRDRFYDVIKDRVRIRRITLKK